MRGVPAQARKDRTDQADLTDLTDLQRAALYARWLEAPEAATRANALICLIHQANFLLDRQIAALEAAFIEDGGYSEQLATERLRQRAKERAVQPAPNAPAAPKCPQCGGLMALRTAKAGKQPGSQFWGCIGYPECRGTAPV